MKFEFVERDFTIDQYSADEVFTMISTMVPSNTLKDTNTLCIRDINIRYIDTNVVAYTQILLNIW